jgi:hypothetical protein
MNLFNYAFFKSKNSDYEKEKRSELLKKFIVLKKKVTEAARTFPSQEYVMLRWLLKDCVENLALRFRSKIQEENATN